MKIEDIKFFDCHSHPHDKMYHEKGVDIGVMMQNLQEAGGATIAIGTDLVLSQVAVDFAKKYGNCFATIGVHPADNHAEVWDEIGFQKLLNEGEGKVVGVGECGLDYFYFEKRFGGLREGDGGGKKGEHGTGVHSAFFAAVQAEKERQKKLFISQIEFAQKNNLPLVLHGRPSKNSMDAYRGILDILEEYSPLTRRREGEHALTGHAHFFVGNLEIAKRFLEIGFSLSFDGPITFTQEYDEVIKYVPLDKILIETDSPYAAPMPYRGQLNYPIYVLEVAKKIAQLKNTSTEEVLETTKNNTLKLFKVKL